MRYRCKYMVFNPPSASRNTLYCTHHHHMFSAYYPRILFAHSFGRLIRMHEPWKIKLVYIQHQIKAIQSTKNDFLVVSGCIEKQMHRILHYKVCGEQRVHSLFLCGTCQSLLRRVIQWLTEVNKINKLVLWSTMTFSTSLLFSRSYFNTRRMFWM